MMGRTKRHHIVPKTYLKRFSDNGKQVFAQICDKPIRKVGISDICVSENFYDVDKSIQSDTITIDYIEKNFLANEAEPQLSECLSKLESVNDILNECPFEYKLKIAESLCIQYYRGLPFRNEAEYYGKYTQTLLAKLFISPDIEMSSLPSNSKSFSLEHAYDTFMNKSYVSKKANCLANGYWKIIHSESINFITSDNPVVSICFTSESECSRFSKIDIGSEQSVVIFPFSPKDCLIICIGFEMRPNEKMSNIVVRVPDCDIETVKAINLIQRRNSVNTIIAKSDQDLRQSLNL